jgi:hypothetical protein
MMGYGLHCYPHYESINIGIEDIDILVRWTTLFMDHNTRVTTATFLHNNHHGRIAWIYIDIMFDYTYIGYITPTMHLLP